MFTDCPRPCPVHGVAESGFASQPDEADLGIKDPLAGIVCNALALRVRYESAHWPDGDTLCHVLPSYIEQCRSKAIKNRTPTTLTSENPQPDFSSLQPLNAKERLEHEIRRTNVGRCMFMVSGMSAEQGWRLSRINMARPRGAWGFYIPTGLRPQDYFRRLS